MSPLHHEWPFRIVQVNGKLRINQRLQPWSSRLLFLRIPWYRKGSLAAARSFWLPRLQIHPPPCAFSVRSPWFALVISSLARHWKPFPTKIQQIATWKPSSSAAIPTIVEGVKTRYPRVLGTQVTTVCCDSSSCWLFPVNHHFYDSRLDRYLMISTSQWRLGANDWGLMKCWVESQEIYPNMSSQVRISTVLLYEGRMASNDCWWWFINEGQQTTTIGNLMSKHVCE